MNLQALRYAIQDAKRFSQRAEELVKVDIESGEFITVNDADAKTIRRLSLDVTHAMKDLRDSIETKVGEE